MSYAQTFLRLIRYAGSFLYELAVSNWQVARMVLSPGFNFRSAAIRYRSKMKTPTEMILITNSITLTPGTLVMDANLESGEILVHVMSAESPDAVRRSLDTFPETKALRALRGEEDLS